MKELIVNKEGTERSYTSLRETLAAVKRAVNLSVQEADRWAWTHDKFLLPWEKAWIVLTTLWPPNLRECINILSSLEYGRHIFSQAFPRSENSNDYNSRKGVVYLDEHPIQVLGWEDVDKLVKEAVDEGFQEEWVRVGFDEEAERRGIDPDFHFFREVLEQNKPQQRSSTQGTIQDGQARLLK